MILWVILFVLVVAISFILAVRSMRDFTEIPQGQDEYSLFLIRKSHQLDGQLFNSIRQQLLLHNTFISFERLFKGKKSALVVFGPRKLLLNYKDILDLLELEDYTNVDIEHFFAWEVGIKKGAQLTQKLFTHLPHFLEKEEFWWQVILSASFKAQITAILVSEDATRRNQLVQNLQNLAPDRIIKLPKAFSNTQILDFYKKRSFRKDSHHPVLTSEATLHLLF